MRYEICVEIEPRVDRIRLFDGIKGIWEVYTVVLIKNVILLAQLVIFLETISISAPLY